MRTNRLYINNNKLKDEIAEAEIKLAEIRVVKIRWVINEYATMMYDTFSCWVRRSVHVEIFRRRKQNKKKETSGQSCLCVFPLAEWITKKTR